MAQQIVTLSSKGQISIPVSLRKNITSNKYLVEIRHGEIVLKPINIKVLNIAMKDSDAMDLNQAVVATDDMWGDHDDVYWEYYKNQKDEK